MSDMLSVCVCVCRKRWSQHQEGSFYWNLAEEQLLPQTTGNYFSNGRPSSPSHAVQNPCSKPLRVYLEGKKTPLTQQLNWNSALWNLFSSFLQALNHTTGLSSQMNSPVSCKASTRQWRGRISSEQSTCCQLFGSLNQLWAETKDTLQCSSHPPSLPGGLHGRKANGDVETWTWQRT